MIASPSESSTRLAMAKTTPMRATTRYSMGGSRLGGSGTALPLQERTFVACSPWRAAECALEFRRVLLVLVGIGYEVADLHRVRGFHVGEALHYRESVLVVDLGKMHAVDDVMALGIEPDVSLR